MKRASSSPWHPAEAGSRTFRRSLTAVVVVAATAFALGACGGDDDDDSSESSTTTTLAPSDDTTTTTSPASDTTTTAAPDVPDEVEYVTDGAIVVVANASGINGAAGRMSDQLEVVGYDMGTPTNSTEGQIEITQIYYDPENPDALPVAESLRLALGGGDIELLEMGVPAPVEGGDIGDATVLITMGNDTADKTLEQLQGRAPAATDSGTDDTTDTDETTETSEVDGDDGEGALDGSSTSAP